MMYLHANKDGEKIQLSMKGDLLFLIESFSYAVAQAMRNSIGEEKFAKCGRTGEEFMEFQVKAMMDILMPTVSHMFKEAHQLFDNADAIAAMAAAEAAEEDNEGAEEATELDDFDFDDDKEVGTWKTRRGRR